jgi:ribosomal protein S18 acetylase RimI-like enzyme
LPRLTDKDEIRALLQRDRRWCVYALGDLTPRMFVKCSWFTPDLTMVLHDYGTSILFAHGTGSIREALEHVAWPVHLQVQQEGLDEIARHAAIRNVKHMWRMAWKGGDTDIAEGVRRLSGNDVGALRRLFADGDTTGEAPDFFYDSMVPNGVFFGVYEGPDLVAAAGTHLFAPDEHAAAIGNVYTRRDRRSRGLSRAVTSAVLHRLRHLETVGLNVREDNAAAIRVYESLGFVKHCEFREGLATVKP